MTNKPENSKRRAFLKNFAIIGTLFVAIGMFFRNLWEYIYPPKEKKKYHKYLVAKIDSVPVGKAKEIKLGKTPVFVVHLPDGYRVFSGICTHLGCIVRWEEEKQRFFCPCHKGIYDKTGKVIGGPPPRPLDQYKVEVDKNLVYIYVESKTRGPWA
jgi:cytochrome b6-f complex iron-sulfur subunit